MLHLRGEVASKNVDSLENGVLEYALIERSGKYKDCNRFWGKKTLKQKKAQGSLPFWTLQFCQGKALNKSHIQLQELRRATDEKSKVL